MDISPNMEYVRVTVINGYFGYSVAYAQTFFSFFFSVHSLPCPFPGSRDAAARSDSLSALTD